MSLLPKRLLQDDPNDTKTYEIMPQYDAPTHFEALQHFNASTITVQIMKMVANQHKKVFKPFDQDKQFQDFIHFITHEEGAEFFKEQQEQIDTENYKYTEQNCLHEHEQVEDEVKLTIEISATEANKIIQQNKAKRRREQDNVNKRHKMMKKSTVNRQMQSQNQKIKPVHFKEDMTMKEILQIIKNRETENYQPQPTEQQTTQDKIEQLFISTIKEDILGFKLTNKNLHTFFSNHKKKTQLNQITKTQLTKMKFDEIFNQQLSPHDNAKLPTIEPAGTHEPASSGQMPGLPDTENNEAINNNKKPSVPEPDSNQQEQSTDEEQQEEEIQQQKV